MNPITAKKILFIKLGAKGCFEKQCIEQNNSIKLGYGNVDHNLCINKEWSSQEIYDSFINEDKGAKTRHINQIKQFYEEPSSTMWITFYENQLWYCFADTNIILNSDKTKERKTINGWSNLDINGNTLEILGLSGKLTQVRGFQGTICCVNESDYLLRRINCEKDKYQLMLEESLSKTKEGLIGLIKQLHDKDFEIFVDLIFRYAGWSRFGQMGKTIKDIDIQLVSPVTKKSAVVQVKSSLNKSRFREVEKVFEDMENSYDEYFIVFHSPEDDLLKYLKTRTQNEKIIIWNVEKLAELSINAGLINWLIDVTK